MTPDIRHMDGGYVAVDTGRVHADSVCRVTHSILCERPECRHTTWRVLTPSEAREMGYTREEERDGNAG
jgi:hypothetical protein